MMAYAQIGRNVIRHQLSASERGIQHPLFYAVQGVRHRKLEVILTNSIDKLGKAGDTVKVAPGFFRNHLMPKLLAVPNIHKYRYLLKDQSKIYQPKEDAEVNVVSQTNEDKMKEYQTAANRLDRTMVVLRKFIKVDYEIREPVTKEEIIAEVRFFWYRCFTLFCSFPAMSIERNMSFFRTIVSSAFFYTFMVFFYCDSLVLYTPSALQWCLHYFLRPTQNKNKLYTLNFLFMKGICSSNYLYLLNKFYSHFSFFNT
ncbi:hypothetical protein DM860_009071 [Cuscuta australis]|uniref:Large ribosomal subunit protein bL9c n=1 Tax=Cuscuta australis TaxID=267555 RepID=A0A328DC28_9ASTE|nr:hypothetical protein DM860_009071 [Cuscuta australis]